MMVKISFLLTSFMLTSFLGCSDDSTNVQIHKRVSYEHKPKRAALWSIFPGAGQIYNEIGYLKVANKKHRAWWKVPIIYGGMGVCGYFFYDNYINARKLKEEVLFRRENGNGTNLHSDLMHYQDENSLIRGYKDVEGTVHLGFDLRAKRRDIFIAATLGVYALNIVEAFVDGHFVSFDVSEDLSLSCTPLMFDKYSPGLRLKLSIID